MPPCCDKPVLNFFDAPILTFICARCGAVYKFEEIGSSCKIPSKLFLVSKRVENAYWIASYENRK